MSVAAFKLFNAPVIGFMPTVGPLHFSHYTCLGGSKRPAVLIVTPLEMAFPPNLWLDMMASGAVGLYPEELCGPRCDVAILDLDCL